jgi:4-hydroxy-tetrahydrodipicolinate reductase
MNILILGYGKMGKAIEEIAVDRGHEIKHKININNTNALKFIDPEEIDVAIEFSQPDAAFSNISYCLERNIPIVSGTTGWLDRKEEVERLCQEKNGTFFYASNFSLGVNLFFKLNELLAKMIRGHKDYDPDITEIHHTEKKDAPSGTAITLAEGIIAGNDVFKRWVLKENPDTDVAAHQIPITSIRENSVPGKHIVKYQSDIDDIEIKHTAHSRDGFALGAVLVSEWIKGKKGVFNMNDFMNF